MWRGRECSGYGIEERSGEGELRKVVMGDERRRVEERVLRSWWKGGREESEKSSVECGEWKEGKGRKLRGGGEGMRVAEGKSMKGSRGIWVEGGDEGKVVEAEVNAVWWKEGKEEGSREGSGGERSEF
jgi:hypothetical protein